MNAVNEKGYPSRLLKNISENRLPKIRSNGLYGVDHDDKERMKRVMIWKDCHNRQYTTRKDSTITIYEKNILQLLYQGKRLKSRFRIPITGIVVGKMP